MEHRLAGPFLSTPQLEPRLARGGERRPVVGGSPGCIEYFVRGVAKKKYLLFWADFDMPFLRHLKQNIDILP